MRNWRVIGMVVVGLAALIVVFGVAGCASTNIAPTAQQVQNIQTACAVDAGIRPTVTALEIFMTPAEIAGLTAARAVIDPICANPSATLQTDAISAFSAATAQVVQIQQEAQTRKAASGN